MFVCLCQTVQGGGKVSDKDIFLVFAACGLSPCQTSSTVRVVRCFKHFPFCSPCSIKVVWLCACLANRGRQSSIPSSAALQPGSVCGCSSCNFCSTLPREPRLPPPSLGEVNNFLVLSVWLSIHKFLNKKAVMLLNIWNCQAFLKTLYFSCSERDSCLFLRHRNGPSRRFTAPAFLQHCHSLLQTQTLQAVWGHFRQGAIHPNRSELDRIIFR